SAGAQPKSTSSGTAWDAATSRVPGMPEQPAVASTLSTSSNSKGPIRPHRSRRPRRATTWDASPTTSRTACSGTGQHPTRCPCRCAKTTAWHW
ncbi:unnamed protein product, partial [Ectocarpus sp. 12 AP-2014]